MRIRTTLDREAGLRTHVVEGAVDVEGILAELERIYSAPDFDPDVRVLWDLRAASASDLGFEDVQRLGQTIGKLWGSSGRGRAALLAGGDLLFGLARQYEFLVEEQMERGVRVFREHERALAWLRGDED